MDANQLRRAFTEFFVERGHVPVPSASLIPHDPTVLFTVAGMVPFKPYFLGEEQAPFKRATTIQKCMRAGGKHNDLDQIGRTARHLTFFEMLGNFSFGDYFKEQAIPFAWELVTTVLGIDPDRLWVTVHLSDDEAERIWRDEVGVPAGRIQRLDEDNWWQMADTGPCGPCSEIYFDKGAEYGQEGGPAFGSDERYLEIWNLVFMQYDRSEDGALHPLPKPCIDTGAGLERILPVLQGKGSVYETDLLRPMLDLAIDLTGATYGEDYETDVSLRIMADHARSMTFLVADGVLPSNEGRGYVLRRIIRRAALRGWRIGHHENMLGAMVDKVVAAMGEAYPELPKQQDFIRMVITREEERFARTLRAGSNQLDAEIAEGGTISGAAAFRLHDTYGFPIELTEEIAASRGVHVDMEGFHAAMAEQRARARADFKEKGVEAELTEAYRELAEQFGPTEFSGYETTEDTARVLGVFELTGQPGVYEIFLDRTPFYAEQGGQVGDTGTISGDEGVAEILDTNYAVGALIRHRARFQSGSFTVGQLVKATVDADRRARIRRNHTATHLAHWALRAVLGEHVKQQGSLVAPDRLRFDFFHWGQTSSEELRRVEELVNGAIFADQDVVTVETSKADAEGMGAIAFFGDKYGDKVRVVKAGENSLEFCGGTHVHSLGDIGLFVMVSEGSIGANTRRIEALTGRAALDHLFARSDQLGAVARELGVAEGEVLGRIETMRAKERELAESLRTLEAERVGSLARTLAASATDGAIVERVDGLGPAMLKDLASVLKSMPGVEVVVLASAVDAGRAALVAARGSARQLDVSELVAGAARLLGGGVGRSPEFAQSGGKNLEAIDEALALVRTSLAER
ncbi:MAG: alanine--tRNA ligase [Actinomycetota bacterium]|nr:alanine--tRNA ligase [Actinomycetota bacterium]